MASSFSVAAEGRRVTVRVTPMQPLSAILAAAAAALSPPIADPSATCFLKVNGKVVSQAELGTPIRFANLSASTVKLELLTGRERGLGVAGGGVVGAAEKRAEATTTMGSMATTTAGLSSSAAAAVLQPPFPAAPAVPRSTPTATAAVPAAAGGALTSLSAAAAPPLPPPPPPPAAAAASAAAAATTSAAPPPPRPPAPPLPPRAPLLPLPKPADPAVVIESSVRTHLSASNGGVAGLGLEEGDVAVFSRDDLEKAAAAARGGVPLDALASSSSTPDSFFEFTAEDYRAVLGSYRGRHEAAASAPLRTSQQRAAEEAAKAAGAGDVRLRVHFADRSILQFRLPATAPLGVLREVVSRALERRNEKGAGGGVGGDASTSDAAPSPSSPPPPHSPSLAPAHLAPWEWEIYTAPPKTVLRPADDARETLFSLGLSPAANVHCGLASASNSRISGSSCGAAAAAAAKATSTTTTTAAAAVAAAAREAPRLRPELLALRRNGVVPGASEAEREAKARAVEEAKGRVRGSTGGGTAVALDNSDSSKGKGKAGVPKWMKMGK